MAALKVVQNQPDRLELGRGGANAVGPVIGIAVFAMVACVGLSTLLENGGDLNPVVLFIVLVIGLVVLNSLLGALRGTQVVVDAGQRTAARVDTLATIPINSRQLVFDRIRSVQVVPASRTPGLATDNMPVWRAQLRATDGSTLVLNERGTRREMQSLADQVAELMRLPVRDEAAFQPEPAVSAPTPTYAAGGVLGSLFENLDAFAQSAGESIYTGPLSPPSPVLTGESPRLRQDDAESKPKKKARSSSPPPTPPPNTFMTTAPQVNAELPYAEASQQVSAQQTAAAAYNAVNAPVSFAPVLAMPSLPPLGSFAPALDLPSFPPIGGMLAVPSSRVPEAQEIKEVTAQVVSHAAAGAETRAAVGDALEQYRAGRRMYAARDLRGAREAYLRALSVSPADAAIQNDLGIAYFDENRLHDAEQAFRRAVALDPFTTAGRYNLGLTLQRLNRRSEAYEQFKLGTRNADRADAEHFENALRGVLHAPLPSPAP